MGPLGILSLCTGCIWHVLSYQAQAWSRTRIQSTCQWQLEVSNVIPQNYVEFLYLSTPLIPVFGLTVLIISTTKRITLPCTIAVIDHTIMHTAQQLQWYFGQICTHERHRIPSPNGWAMGWVSFMSYTKNNYRDISRTHWVANSTGYDLCWITCHKQSLFSSVSKKRYISHELTWWYWHIHVALCSTLFKVIFFSEIRRK